MVKFINGWISTVVIPDLWILEIRKLRYLDKACRISSSMMLGKNPFVVVKVIFRFLQV